MGLEEQIRAIAELVLLNRRHVIQIQDMDTLIVSVDHADLIKRMDSAFAEKRAAGGYHLSRHLLYTLLLFIDPNQQLTPLLQYLGDGPTWNYS